VLRGASELGAGDVGSTLAVEEVSEPLVVVGLFDELRPSDDDVQATSIVTSADTASGSRKVLRGTVPPTVSRQDAGGLIR
jgi:hypothetical protein